MRRFIRGKNTAEEGTIEPAKKLEKVAQYSCKASHWLLDSLLDPPKIEAIARLLLAAQSFFFFRELIDPNINKDPIYATSQNVGPVNYKGVQSKAETHLKSPLALHSCDHFEFSSGSLMNTFMIHDHYVLFPGTYISLALFNFLSSKSLLNNSHVWLVPEQELQL